MTVFPKLVYRSFFFNIDSLCLECSSLIPSNGLFFLAIQILAQMTHFRDDFSWIQSKVASFSPYHSAMFYFLYSKLSLIIFYLFIIFLLLQPLERNRVLYLLFIAVSPVHKAVPGTCKELNIYLLNVGCKRPSYISWVTLIFEDPIICKALVLWYLCYFMLLPL